MTDPRLSPPADQLRLEEPGRIILPWVDLTRGATGARDRQLIFGDPVTILNRSDTHCLLRANKDGYCGTVPLHAVGAPTDATHRVTARATHAYSRPDIKSPDRTTLSFGSLLTAVSELATFIETELGFVPRQHLHRVGAFADDPASVAEMFLGTPYLWGGNTAFGIDCSGLVQAACLACGVPCPGDSDMQAAELGTLLPPETPLCRNDLLFWKGHVALIRDAETLIHANAGHMAVVLEPISDAIRRIDVQGDGLPTLRRRLPFSDPKISPPEA